MSREENGNITHIEDSHYFKYDQDGNDPSDVGEEYIINRDDNDDKDDDENLCIENISFIEIDRNTYPNKKQLIIEEEQKQKYRAQRKYIEENQNAYYHNQICSIFEEIKDLTKIVESFQDNNISN